MSLSLHDQLREYGDQFRAALPTVEVDDVVGVRPSVEPLRPLRRVPQWKRALAVTAVTAVVALLLIGGAAWLLRTPGAVEQPPATEPTPTTVSSPPSTETTVPESDTTVPQGAVDDEGWTAVEVPMTGAQGFIADVAVDETGLVAVGYECGDPCTNTFAAIWTSVDGSVWERAEVASDVLVEGRLEAVARGGAGWVVMGLQQSEVDGSTIAIWWSANGREWQQTPSIAEFTGISRVPLGMAATDSQLLAVGTGMDESGIFGRVWSSIDGLSWTMAAELRDVELLAVAPAGTGFLAFGNAVDENDDFVAAAWTSEDGSEWTRVLEQSETFGGQLGAISAGTGGVIAIGGMPDTAWVSIDGVSWATVEDLELPMETRAVLADEEGFVIVGRGAWWTSPDGTTWQRTDEEDLTDAAIAAVARAGTGVVAVGSQPGQLPTVWILNSRKDEP